MFASLRQKSMMFLLGFVTLAATEARARGQSRTSQQSSTITLRGTNSFNLPGGLPFLTGGIGTNPLAALSAYGGAGLAAGALATPYGNPYASAALLSNAYGGGYGASPYSSGYGNSSGYGTPNSGSYLDPAAEEIKAQGQLMVNQQQAFYIREKVRAERIDNKRKAFDEYIYERDKTPTVEEERRRLQAQQVQRARNDPPDTEIWSGRALNDLLRDLGRPTGNKESAGLGTQKIPLDQDALKHINLTGNAGNIALLKNEGRLHWPVGLSGAEFQAERELLTRLAYEAVKQVEFNGQVAANTIRQMSSTATRMQQQLRKEGETLSSAFYIEAKGFLLGIDSAITALQQADVRHHFTGKYALRASTVPELVKFMTEHGLQFAPALPSDRSAYLALHRALANYDMSTLVQTTAR